MAKNHGKNTPALTFSGIVDREEKKLDSKIYKIAVSEYAIKRNKSLVGKTVNDLMEMATTEPVSLSDVEDVKARSIVYVRGCESVGTIPNISGLCVALGLSRSAFYDCVNNNRPEETAKWFALCREAFSDILGQSSLRGDCNGIYGIFQQKAMYSWRESIEILATPATPMGEDMDVVELQRRIEGGVIYDDDMED